MDEYKFFRNQQHDKCTAYRTCEHVDVSFGQNY